MNFHRAKRHTNEVSKQATFFQNIAKPFDEFNRLLCKASLLIGDDLLKAFVGVFIPYPSVGERLRLCAVFITDVVINLIVVALGIKRRVNVAEVNGFISNVLS